MMGEMIYRTYTPDLEVRSAGDGRTIYGLVVPYGQPQKINEQLIEQFARGTFNHQLRAANRVRLAREHMPLGGTLIGAASLLRDDSAGLYGEFRVSRTVAGDETLELVRDGALQHMSIGFRDPRSRRLRGGVIEHTRADLFEVAVVLQGAYGDLAAVAGVRSSGDEQSPEPTPRLDEGYRMLDDLEALRLPSGGRVAVASKRLLAERDGEPIPTPHLQEAERVLEDLPALRL